MVRGVGVAPVSMSSPATTPTVTSVVSAWPNEARTGIAMVKT